MKLIRWYRRLPRVIRRNLTVAAITIPAAIGLAVIVNFTTLAAGGIAGFTVGVAILPVVSLATYNTLAAHNRIKAWRKADPRIRCLYMILDRFGDGKDTPQ